MTEEIQNAYEKLSGKVKNYKKQLCENDYMIKKADLPIYFAKKIFL